MFVILCSKDIRGELLAAVTCKEQIVAELKGHLHQAKDIDPARFEAKGSFLRLAHLPSSLLNSVVLWAEKSRVAANRWIGTHYNHRTGSRADQPDNKFCLEDFYKSISADSNFYGRFDIEFCDRVD